MTDTLVENLAHCAGYTAWYYANTRYGNTSDADNDLKDIEKYCSAIRA